MAVAVRLTVITGPHRGRRFCFSGPNRCQVGRGLDCFIQLSGTERDKLISRCHCQLEIDPPAVRVNDLGSVNGTYINGCKLEPRPGDMAENDRPGAELGDGDVITIGGTTLRVDMLECPHANEEVQGRPLWEPGETAKIDCPLSC